MCLVIDGSLTTISWHVSWDGLISDARSRLICASRLHCIYVFRYVFEACSVNSPHSSCFPTVSHGVFRRFPSLSNRDNIFRALPAYILLPFSRSGRPQNKTLTSFSVYLRVGATRFPLKCTSKYILKVMRRASAHTYGACPDEDVQCPKHRMPCDFWAVLKINPWWISKNNHESIAIDIVWTLLFVYANIYRERDICAFALDIVRTCAALL